MREKDSLSRSMIASVSSCQFVEQEQVHQFYDVGPVLALNGPAKLARSGPLSEADRKSFEPSEHFRW
jgi:hypothetical protein